MVETLLHDIFFSRALAERRRCLPVAQAVSLGVGWLANLSGHKTKAILLTFRSNIEIHQKKNIYIYIYITPEQHHKQRRLKRTIWDVGGNKDIFLPKIIKIIKIKQHREKHDLCQQNEWNVKKKQEA